MNYQRGPYGIIDIIETLDTINDAYTPSNWNEAFSWGNHAQAGYALASSLASVATSGSYNDLSDKPDIDGDVAGLQEQIDRVRVLALAGI